MAIKIEGTKFKGLKTPPGQFKALTLYWNAFQDPILKEIGFCKVKATEQGGFKITSPKLAASIMNDIYTGKIRIKEGLDIKAADPATAKRIMQDVKTLSSPLSLQLSQRLFDMRSSYDLRSMANLVYANLWKTGFSITETDMMDPSMKNLLNLPGCSILGCDFGPTFKITVSDDPDTLVYDAGKFMKEQVTFNRKTDKFRLDSRGMVEISKDGGDFQPAPLSYVFPYLYSQAGLSGLALHMTDYNPLTALGGMGMSNLLVFKSLTSLHFLLNTGADLGTIFSQGGYIEKYKFDRETGFQEAQQVVSGGHLSIMNAPGIFGGMARRLDLQGHHRNIKDNMHLVLFNRPAENVKRAPINDTWCRQADDPAFNNVYMDQFEITGREVSPFIEGSNGGSLNFSEVAKAYREHSIRRWKCCPAYHGNEGQKAFIDKIHSLGGAAFPLGEGGEKAAMLDLLNRANYAKLGLKYLTAEDANRTTGFITGEIAYNLLDNAPIYGDGYLELAQTGNYGFARPPLELVTYKQ